MGLDLEVLSSVLPNLYNTKTWPRLTRSFVPISHTTHTRHHAIIVAIQTGISTKRPFSRSSLYIRMDVLRIDNIQPSAHCLRDALPILPHTYFY